MAGAPNITYLPIERPGAPSSARPGSGSHLFSETPCQQWINAFFVKHSGWYRRHFLTPAAAAAAGGRKETTSSRSSSSSSSVVAASEHDVMGDGKERKETRDRGRKGRREDVGSGSRRNKKSLAELERERRVSDCASVDCCA